jgi:hypothetical protein
MDTTPAIIVYESGLRHHPLQRVRLAVWPGGTTVWRAPADPRAPYREANIPFDRFVSELDALEAEGVLDLAALCPDPRRPSSHVEMTTVYYHDGRREARLRYLTEPRYLPDDDCQRSTATAIHQIEHALFSLIPTREGDFRTTDTAFRLLLSDADGKLRSEPYLRQYANPWDASAPVTMPRLSHRPDEPVLAITPDGTHLDTPRFSFVLYGDGAFLRARSLGILEKEAIAGKLSTESMARLLERLAKLDRLDSALLCNPDRGVVGSRLTVNLPGLRFALASFHPNVERRGEDGRPSPWIKTAYGKDLRGSRTDEQWLADEPECYQRFRALWAEIEAAIEEALPPFDDSAPVVEGLTWTIETLGPPILPGSPVPQPAPGP